MFKNAAGKPFQTEAEVQGLHVDLRLNAVDRYIDGIMDRSMDGNTLSYVNPKPGACLDTRDTIDRYMCR